LKEKLLAAQRGGIRRVIIPKENERDLKEIPDSVKAKLVIIPVKWMDEVLEIALERLPHPLEPDAGTPTGPRPPGDTAGSDAEVSINPH
jgi:ATP-dependent Lon protease